MLQFYIVYISHSILGPWELAQPRLGIVTRLCQCSGWDFKPERFLAGAVVGNYLG